MQKIIALLIVALLSFNADAQSSITSKKIKFDDGDEDEIIEYKQPIKAKLVPKEQIGEENLLGRIEILEHVVSILKNRLDNMESFSIDKVQASSKAPNINDEDKGDSTAELDDDLFNIESEAKPKVPAKVELEKIPIIVKANEVAKDKKAYDMAFEAFKTQKPLVGRTALKSFIDEYPKSNLQSNALYWYGETFYKEKKYQDAAVNFLKSYKQSSIGPKASDSLLKLADSLYHINRKTEACNMLDKLNKEFPKRSSSSIKDTKDLKVKIGCK